MMTAGQMVAGLVFVAVGGATVSVVCWLRPRLARRNRRILAVRERRAALGKGGVDDLMDVAHAAGVARESTTMGPMRAPLLRVGDRLVHPQCMEAKDAGRFARICDFCYPTLFEAASGRGRGGP